MSKKFKGALQWAMIVKSSQALNETIQRILSAGYTISDVQDVLSETP